MPPKITPYEIEIGGIKILLLHKKIRNLNIRIALPDGEVRVAAPLRYGMSQIREFVLQKIDWIKKSQMQIRSLRDQGKIILPAKFISGEEHYFFGKKFRFELLQNSTKNRLEIDDETMFLHVKNLSNFKQRQKLVDDFYRREIKKIIPSIIGKYEEKMNVRANGFGVKKMKTRWGTCNVERRFIWLNLELAKREPQFLESVIVHEMVHFFERKHGKNFYALMDKFMPEWRSSEREFAAR